MAYSSDRDVESSGLQRRLDSKELPSVCSLGKGLSGFVYETIWKGNKYARKDFPLGSEEGNCVFESEAESLLELEHPHVVKCFGYTMGASSCSLLQEYMDGNLQNTIRRRIETRSNSNEDSKSGSGHLRVVDVDEMKSLLSGIKVREITVVDEACSSKTPGSSIVPFDVPEAVDIISQIAAGMSYLHQYQVVHGDLKPQNVLLHFESGAMKAKLADFGLVETKKRIKLVSKRRQHFETLMWKAPELFEELLGPLSKDSDDLDSIDSDTDEESARFGSHDRTSNDVHDSVVMAKADVYSFGLTCSHILGGKLFYPGLSLTKLRRQRMGGFRPELPSVCPNYLQDIVYSCLDFDPMIRPTFFVICAQLKAPLKLQLPLTGFRSLPSLERTRLHDVSTPPGIDELSNEVLGQNVFPKLPLFDLLRARAVCKRWQEITAQTLDEYCSQAETKSYCPLVFKRDSEQHLWCGYDTITRTWQMLPPLKNLPQVDIRPLAGNGKRLMGFRITRVLSQLVVGNPFTGEWYTIPKSTDTWGEVGNVLVVDRSNESFQIIAMREDATEIFHSQMEMWTKLGQSPPPGLQEITVLCMRDKLVCASLCRGLLFCYAGDALVSFDVVAERWTEDHIRLPPHTSPKCFQMLECGGNLFVAIEDVTRGTISVQGLGLGRREFFPVVEMPPQLYSVLSRKKRSGKPLHQLKAVGHKHQMYFWRNNSSDIVVFHHLRRTWAELPQFDQCLSSGQFGPDLEIQVFIDTSSFEP